VVVRETVSEEYSHPLCITNYALLISKSVCSWKARHVTNWYETLEKNTRSQIYLTRAWLLIRTSLGLRLDLFYHTSHTAHLAGKGDQKRISAPYVCTAAWCSMLNYLHKKNSFSFGVVEREHLPEWTCQSFLCLSVSVSNILLLFKRWKVVTFGILAGLFKRWITLSTG